VKRLFSQIAIILLLLIVSFPFATENIFTVYDLDDLVTEISSVRKSRKVTIAVIHRSVKSEPFVVVVVASCPPQRYMSASTTPAFALARENLHGRSPPVAPSV
jgi:hypothetical protein